MHWLLILAVLLAGAALILLYLLKRMAGLDSKQRFDEVLSARGDGEWLASAMTETRAGRGSDMLRRVSVGESVDLDLRRMGWTSPGAHRAYFTAAALGPVLGMLAGSAWGAFRGDELGNMLSPAFLGFAGGYLLPPRLLHWLAQRRRSAMQEEMLGVLHLLRMLLEAGLSLEHALRVVSEQGRELAPLMASEIGAALTRINTGQDCMDALEEMAAPLGLPELDDTVAILKQATRYGGSLRESLSRFALLMEERRMTNLREYVSKLSAKMTMVTVVFMFPALMLFLAGPGFLALINALTRMQ